jgi:hypothetical protein
MSIICPECEYTRKPTDIAPIYECPKCGVIYAKAKPKSTGPINVNPDAKPLVLPTQEKVPKEKPKLELSQKQLVIGALVFGIVLGYFIGREHIKYELRSAFQDAAAGITKGFGNVFGGSDLKSSDKPSRTPSIKKVFPITATLLKKDFFEGEYGKKAITFSVAFQNGTGKGIRAFDGTLIFTDLLGNEILGAKLAVNNAIGQGQSLDWEGKLDYNQFIASHESLRNAEIQNTKSVFVLKRILFQDGEVKDF